jgi:hypothetical protein
MSDYKIHIDRKMPSDEQIEKQMNFEALLNQYHQQTGMQPPKATQFVPLYKRKYTRYAAAAMVFLAIGTFLAMPYFQKDTNTSDPNVVVTPVDSNNPKTDAKKEEAVIQKPENKAIAENTIPKKEDISTAKTANPKPFNLDSATATLPPLPEKPLMPEKPKAGLIGIKQDLNEFPELKPYQDVLWAYVDTDDEPLTPKGAPQDNTWNDAKIKKVGENVYEMTLSRNKGKEVKTVKVKPVFKGEGYNKAMEKYNALMEQYNKAAEDRAKKEAEFKAKAKK